MIYFLSSNAEFIPTRLLNTDLGVRPSFHTEVEGVIRKLHIKRALSSPLSQVALVAAVVCSFAALKHGLFEYRPLPQVSMESEVSRMLGSRLAVPTILESMRPHPMPAPVINKAVETRIDTAVVATMPVVAKVSPPNAPYKVAIAPVKKIEDDEDLDDQGDDEIIAQTFLDNAPVEEELAIEDASPLDKDTDAAFAEISVSPDFDQDTRISALQSDPMFVEMEMDRQMPREQRLALVMGTVQKNDFSEIKRKLEVLKTSIPAVAVSPKASEPVSSIALADEPQLVKPGAKAAASLVAVPVIASKVEAQLRAPRVEGEPELMRPTTQSSLVTKATARKAENEKLTEEAANEDSATEAVATTPTVSAHAASAAGSGPVLAALGAPVTLATPAPRIAVSAPKPVAVATPTVTTQADPEVQTDAGMLYGKISVDHEMADWLAAAKGHVELYLHPVKSKDTQDTIFIDYQYPDEEFETDISSLKGRYRLVAGIFVPKATTAIAQIVYPNVITAADYKNRVVFTVRKASFDQAQKRSLTNATELVLSATLFEGASGNYRQPKPVKNGKVKVVGYPELGTISSDADGNVRIPSVPGRSELLLEVSAEGYYPAYPIVPTFSSNVYSPIYLISKDKVDAITKYFTKNQQSDRRGIVMGRVFDSTSRAPLKDERVSLSFRKGRALYFDALPDPWLQSTTESGLFGFFNVAPSFRSLVRQSGKPAFLLNVKPGSAQYVELGRGGKKALQGRLIDPFSTDHTMPIAKVRLVGAPASEVLTDPDGKFSIPELDYPPGVLTLEIESEGYPVTWHSLPWNTREPEAVRSLFMVQKDLVTESATRVARITMRRDRGSVVGGAEASFFGKGTSCVLVAIEDANGARIDETNGPFPLVGDAQAKGSPLCLTRQKPGFAFFNMAPGEYILKWQTRQGVTFRSRVVHVGTDRVSVIVN